MTFNDCEIYARTYVEGSDLWSLDSTGELLESMDIFVENEGHGDILWYEIEYVPGEQFKTLKEAKEGINKYIKENQD